MPWFLNAAPTSVGTPRRLSERRVAAERGADRVGRRARGPTTHAAISSSSSSAIASIIASRARLAAAALRGRDRAVGERRAEARGVPGPRAHRDQVDHAAEGGVAGRADQRELDHDRVRTEPALHHRDHAGRDPRPRDRTC